MTNISRNIFSLTLAAALTLSCGKGNLGTILPDSVDTGYTFDSEVFVCEVDASNDGVARIPLYRSNVSEAEQVKVRIEFNDGEGGYVETDPEKIFRLTTTKVFFAEGRDCADVQVSFTSLGDIGYYKLHQFRLSLEGSPAAEAGSDSFGNITCTTVTLSQKLVFDYLGKGTCYDEFLFYETYPVDIYKARNCPVYRIMDPWSAGLLAEDYVKNGWATTHSDYVQIDRNADGTLHFAEFKNGMYFQAMYNVYGVHPDDREENKDVDLEKYVSMSRVTADNEMTIYPFYYIKGYGYFDCIQMVITFPEPIE